MRDAGETAGHVHGRELLDRKLEGEGAVGLAGEGGFAGGVHGTVGHRLLVSGSPARTGRPHVILTAAALALTASVRSSSSETRTAPVRLPSMLQRFRHIQESTFPAAETALCVPKRNAKEFVTAKITYSEEKVNLACDGFHKNVSHKTHLMGAKNADCCRRTQKSRLPADGKRQKSGKTQTSKSGSSFSTWMLVMKGLCSGSWNGASLTYLFSATAVRAGSAMVPAPPMQPPGQPMPSSR